MNASLIAEAQGLLAQAQLVYLHDAAASSLIQGYSQRLQEPLRIAVAGMVKAGKSTLLNAIIGEEIAPTDTGECTRIVTWYQYGHTPRVTLYPVTGEPFPLPIRRVSGRLVFDLGPMAAEEVERLVVEWPSWSLQDVTLIDTPGIGSLSAEVSARSLRFLTPAEAPSQADAVIYLMRHMHATDLRFLESFRDTRSGQSSTVNSLAVLSRADEIGAGRLDSLLSAAEIAERYRRDKGLRTLALDVIPIAGLMAQSSRSLRQAEYEALTRLARLDRPAREKMLISADRFVQSALEGVDEDARTALLERFGLFGIRMAAALIRGGAEDPTSLAHELSRRSGLEDLLRAVALHFQDRAGDLKARTALAGVESLLRDKPVPGSEILADSLERIHATAHELRELKLLAALRTTGVSLTEDLALEAERLLGGRGVAPEQRLGLDDDAATAELDRQARLSLKKWRTVAENPLTDRAGVEVCRLVMRSCEGLLDETSATAAR